MAIPFGQKGNPERRQELKNEQDSNLERMKVVKKPHFSVDEASTSYIHYRKSAFGTASKTVPVNNYCISNSKFSNYESSLANNSNIRVGQNVICTDVIDGEYEAGRRIKVRKGVFTSKRIINSEDIQIVCEDLRNDWKILLKRLPGVTFNNSSFHQAFIDAMDRNDSTNMAKIALTTWKFVLPELSTIGNLAKTLFKTGHPDIVTYLRP